jgi:hypothetical protein
MAGFLDYIFSTLDIENLEQQQAKEYLCYLREIDAQVPTIDDKIKFLGYQVRINRRLLAIDSTTVNALQNRLGKGRSTIELKKAKHCLV